MTSEPSRQQEELLELYKLHAELADRVSARREGANRLFVSLLVGLTLFVGLLVRFGPEEPDTAMFMLPFGVAGLALSVAWYVVIRSYRQLNSGKFHVLHELEGKLAFPFFRREWDYLRSGPIQSRYWRLTVVETALPVLFGLLSLGTLGLGLFASGSL